MISKEQFQEAVIRSTWKETSFTPELWEEDNPTSGHCAVVALLAQDIFGGKLLRASLDQTEFASLRSHYWNLLPDGTEIDFTQSQFGDRRPLLLGTVEREYLLQNDEVRKRYEALRIALLSNLAVK